MRGIMNNTKFLLDLKQKIEDAKIEKAQAEGKLSELMEQLNNEFNCKTIESAEEKLEEYESIIEEKQEELNEKIEELKTGYLNE